MQSAFKLPHLDSVVRELQRGVLWAATLARGLNDFRQWQWVDELGKGTGLKLRAKLGRRGVRRALAHGQRYRRHATLREKQSSCQPQVCRLLLGCYSRETSSTKKVGIQVHFCMPTFHGIQSRLEPAE